MGKTHSSIDTYSYKCVAGLKTLLVQYLLMQNRHLTGEKKNPKTRDEWRKVNGGMPLLTDLCLAMRSDPMGIIRGLEEVATCVYGPAVTYAFPDLLVTAYRYSVTHLSLISILDGTTLNWCQQEVLRAQMSNTVLFGKVKDAELMVYSFRGQLQCRMGGKREGPIETYPKLWNLNPLTSSGQDVLRVPAWKKSFELVKRELDAILEKEVLPTSIPEFPTVRRMTLGMNSSLVIPSLFARAAAEEQQREFTDGWDPLFIGYTAAVYFHTSDIKTNSWTTQAKEMRGSMPPKFEVREVLRTLEREDLENMLPVWDDGRMIVEEGHIALKDEMKFATRRYRASYGLEQVEMRQEGKELDAAGPLYVALTDYKKPGPTTPSPLSVGTPGDKRSGPVEDRFRMILERRRRESGEESMDETLSEAGEDMEVGNSPEPKRSEEEFTTQELLKDLSGENWADTATPPLTSYPRKNLELPLTSETPNMGVIFLSAEGREKNTFEGNRGAFLGTLDEDAWREFLSDFNQEVNGEITLVDFKEELLGLEGENTSDHERQNVIGKPMVGASNLEEIDAIHEKMMELEPLLEASGERNLRSVDLTHGDCPCHCLAQTVWYPDHANLCLIWDVEEIRSLGLPDHQQKVTILVVSMMLALRWIEENVAKYRESKTPTAESIYAIDYSRRLELFETACKVFAIPMEVRHVWSRLRFFPWFRATLTSWLYMVTKDHMRKYQREYRQFQAEIGPEAFKRPLLTHRNAITTGWKRVGRVSRNNTRARESILEEDLAKNVSLSLHNSFCLNRESRVKTLLNQAKRLQGQREWMRSYEQLKAWEEIGISSDDEEALLKQITVSNTSGSGTSKAKNAR